MKTSLIAAFVLILLGSTRVIDCKPTTKYIRVLHGSSRQPGTFHKWQARIKSKGAPKNSHPAFAEVQVGSSSSGALFAEVSGIRIYQPVAASYLKNFRHEQ